MIYPLTLRGAKTSKLNENLEDLHLVSASATDFFCIFSGLSMCPAQRNLDLMDISLQRDEGKPFVLQLKRCSSSCCQEQRFSGDPAEGLPSPLLDPTLWQLWGTGLSCSSRGNIAPIPSHQRVHWMELPGGTQGSTGGVFLRAARC